MESTLITAAGRAFVSLRVAGIVPDGALCNMDTGVEHGPQLVPPYNLLSI